MTGLWCKLIAAARARVKEPTIGITLSIATNLFAKMAGLELPSRIAPTRTGPKVLRKRLPKIADPLHFNEAKATVLGD